MRTVDKIATKELGTIVAAIQETLSKHTWSPDTLDIIADILRDAGLEVADAA